MGKNTTNKTTKIRVFFKVDLGAALQKIISCGILCKRREKEVPTSDDKPDPEEVY